MATITKRGKSYLIRCYAGYSVDGKQITKSMTYRPEPGTTPAKIKKEVQRQAVLFEESVKAGECDGKRIKFEKFAEQWLKDYAEVELAQKRCTIIASCSRPSMPISGISIWTIYVPNI